MSKNYSENIETFAYSIEANALNLSKHLMALGDR